MNRNAGLIGILVAACFIAANTVGGCSDGTDRPDNTTDGGSPDAGNKPDGGPVATSGVGAACTGTGQGTCGAGFECRTDLIFTGGYCTKTCTAEADCGKNGTTQNACEDIGETDKICLRLCDPAVANSCNRTGYMCQASSSDPATGICIPDCRAPSNNGMCDQGTQCSQTTGQCERVPGDKKTGEHCDAETNDCVANNECAGTSAENAECFQGCSQSSPCGATQLCVGVGGNTAICLEKCATPNQTSTCTGGKTCVGLNSGNGGVCFLPPPPPGQLAQNGVCTPGATGSSDPAHACGADLFCVQTGQTSGVCMADCTSDANACSEGSSCILPASAGGQNFKLCAAPCGAAGQTCPNGLSCQTVDQQSGTKACVSAQ